MKIRSQVAITIYVYIVDKKGRNPIENVRRTTGKNIQIEENNHHLTRANDYYLLTV